MLLVITVLGIVASMAVFQIEAARPGIKGDGAMRTLMTQLTTARELAMSERRNIEIAFPGPNQVSIIRHEVPAGTTTLRTVALEGGVEFRLIPGVADTPEAFGNAAAVDFGGAGAVMFSTDGSLIDATGNPVSGTVFMAVPNSPRSLRAITLLGPTGRMRAFRWDGVAWHPL
jgi:hypothetical protein